MPDPEAEPAALPSSERPDAYSKAVELLARRTHFRSELGAKLAKKGYSADEVEEVLDRLVDHGYVDDRAAAKQFVEMKTGRGPMGRRRLMADLTKKGAPGEVAAEVLDELLPASDRELARQAAETWYERKRTPRKAALARYLERRGFSPGSIWDALDAFEWPEEEGMS